MVSSGVNWVWQAMAYAPYGAYACDIIIKPGSYAEMLLNGGKKILFCLNTPHNRTEKSILIVLNYIQ